MAEIKTTPMLLKVDLQCPRCYNKIKRLLCGCHEIRDQVFDEERNTVAITVLCCTPERVRQKLIRKGGKAIKSIEITQPHKTKPTPPPEDRRKPKSKPEPVQPEPEKPKAKQSVTMPVHTQAQEAHPTPPVVGYCGSQQYQVGHQQDGYGTQTPAYYESYVRQCYYCCCGGVHNGYCSCRCHYYVEDTFTEDGPSAACTIM